MYRNKKDSSSMTEVSNMSLLAITLILKLYNPSNDKVVVSHGVEFVEEGMYNCEA